MSVAVIRDRPGGWFSPGARKSNKWTRTRKASVATPKKASKPARNVATAKRQQRRGSSFIALVISLLRVMGWVTALVILVALLGGISLGLVYGYRALTSSPHFAVARVEIAGNRQLSTPEVLNLSGVAVGMNILEVSLGEMTHKLQTNPWVESVTVRRMLPDSVIIDVVEREPFFWIQQGGVLYYADRHGMPIAPLELGRFVSLPALIVEEGVEPNQRLVTEWIRAVERLEFPFGFPEVAWLKIEDANILRIFLEDRGMMIHFDLSGWREHREIMNQVWEDLLARGELQDIARMTIMSGKAWVQAKEP